MENVITSRHKTLLAVWLRKKIGVVRLSVLVNCVVFRVGPIMGCLLLERFVTRNWVDAQVITGVDVFVMKRVVLKVVVVTLES